MTGMASMGSTAAAGSVIDAAAWPLARAGEALAALARAARLPLEGAPPASGSGSPVDPSRFGEQLDAAARAFGLEVEPPVTRYGDVEAALRRAAPALVEIAGEAGRAVVALVRVSSSTARVVTPDEEVRRVPLPALLAALRRRIEAKHGPVVGRVLARAALGGAQRAGARRALLDAQLSDTYLTAAHALRLPPGARARSHARALAVPRRLVLLFFLALAAQGAALTGWWLIGRGALEGRLEAGWLWAWALVVLSSLPLSSALSWSQGALALDLSALLRRRLLAGALALPMDQARRSGVGEIVGRVLESAGLEQMALLGSFASALAVIDLAVAASVMVSGPAGWLGAAALGLYGAFLAALVVRTALRFRGWTDARVAMTHALIERMLGHRTRLAQEDPGSWHDEEDADLARYAEASAAWDRSAAWLSSLGRRGFLPVAIASTLPGVLAGASPAMIAVGVGGAILSARALGALTAGALALVGARVMYRGVRPILAAAAAARQEAAAPPLPPGAPPPPAYALLEARDIVFRHPEAARAVLDGVSLTLHEGDRALLEGPSGAGKSTLASILTGLSAPKSGVLLLGGLDVETWTQDGWRGRVVGAPQFHENYVLCDTLAMNLLLGRGFPPTGADLREAEEICEELGLGDLLRRMPSGMMQIVGESGWQLSHGEQSRLFVARALLQRANVILLDEAFGALDPATMRKVLACVEARAPALIVIAHP